MACDEVYIGIGCNLGDREQTLQRAIEVLDAHKEVALISASSVYETAPIGVLDQPAFLNAVLLVKTGLSARDLLVYLLDVEKQFGRVRKKKWGPRTLDLDILLYGDDVIDVPGLTVPHPHLPERAFVLAPLCDLAPQRIHPILGESMQALLVSLHDDDLVQRVDGFHLGLKR